MVIFSKKKVTIFLHCDLIISQYWEEADVLPCHPYHTYIVPIHRETSVAAPILRWRINGEPQKPEIQKLKNPKKVLLADLSFFEGKVIFFQKFFFYAFCIYMGHFTI